MEKIKGDDVNQAFGVVTTIKLWECADDALFVACHATTVGECVERVTRMHTRDQIPFAKAIKSGSRIDDDAAGSKNGLDLGLIQLHS